MTDFETVTVTYSDINISVTTGDHTLSEVVRIFSMCLKGHGFSDETINKYINLDDE